MTSWRTNGTNSVVQFRDEMDRLMSGFLGGVSTAFPRAWATVRAFPPLNVWEEGDHLVAEAELPGVKNEDIDISVTGNELTLRGRRAESAAEETAFHRRERASGDFTRTLRLPYDVDAGAVEASLADGVLTIKLPKAASAKPRKIQVTAAK